MTQDDKKILLKDLYARVPYGVHAKVRRMMLGEEVEYAGKVGIDIEFSVLQAFPYKDDIDIKPYLRPMSSMTLKEEKEYNMALTPLGDFMFEQQEQFKPIQLYKNIPLELYEFFNSHHFDYRGLIEKGLALEAPEGMYNVNKE